jgi:tetratricopeptide (TPR) repeat protein
MEATATLPAGIAPPFVTPRWARRPNTRHYVQGLFDDALRHHRAGRIEHAVTRYQRALALSPEHADAHNNLGVAFVALGRPVDAIAHYRKAIVLNPSHCNAHSNLGTALVSLERFDEATRSYERALALNPHHADGHYNLAIALTAQGRSSDAMTCYEMALALRHDYTEAHNNLGNLLAAQGKTDAAIAHYQQALAVHPHHASALNNLGNMFRDLGRFDEAMGHFDRAIAIRPVSAEAHYHRAEIKTFRTGESDLTALEALARRSDLPAVKAPFIHFALAKALEDTGDFERAFAHLRRGNELKRSQIHYDERGTGEMIRRVAAVFDRGMLDRAHGTGDPSAAPIFVLGMPRSGSTLIEQILASHHKIHGAGELEDLAACLPKGFPECLIDASPDSLRQMGQKYLSRLPALPDGKVCVVDKLPNNFLRIGLIRMILPNARIIHTVRNPIDTCVSCYSKLFAKGQEFTYDLGELGRYYRSYSELMTHWTSVLPQDAMLHVAYEDVVSDLEGQARRLVEYCGLPWDPCCLDFHRTSRPVRTASAVQVRKPLFRSSVDRWRKYEKGLGPLLAELPQRG